MGTAVRERPKTSILLTQPIVGISRSWCGGNARNSEVLEAQRKISRRTLERSAYRARVPVSASLRKRVVNSHARDHLA